MKSLLFCLQGIFTWILATFCWSFRNCISPQFIQICEMSAYVLSLSLCPASLPEMYSYLVTNAISFLFFNPVYWTWHLVPVLLTYVLLMVDDISSLSKSKFPISFCFQPPFPLSWLPFWTTCFNPIIFDGCLGYRADLQKSKCSLFRFSLSCLLHSLHDSLFR